MEERENIIRDVGTIHVLATTQGLGKAESAEAAALQAESPP